MRDNHGPAGTTPRFMYIVAIAWIYVVLLMSFTEATLVAGVATFVFYGLAPLAVVLYLMGTPQRRRNRRKAEAQASGQSAQSAPSTPSAAGQDDRNRQDDG